MRSRRPSWVASPQATALVVTLDGERLTGTTPLMAGDLAAGTYTVAVLAREHDVPFYVAAPVSTIDLSTSDGTGIPIEERDEKEITHLGSTQLTATGAAVWNPAFDVTPASFVAGIITERGICRAPFSESLKEVCAVVGPTSDGGRV